MKTATIHTLIANYANFRQGVRSWNEAWKWEIVKNFQNNWDIEADDFAAMYDRSLHSLMSRRWWSDTGYEPKKRMQEFIGLQPDWTRHLFRDLFDESKSLDARIGRFLFGCDELMAEYREKHPTSIETSHYHEDYRMISLYLALRYPDAYAPYEFGMFQRMLELLESKDIPVAHDLPRYMKVASILNTFLSKETSLLELHRQAIRGKAFYQDECFMLVHDFIQHSTS